MEDQRIAYLSDEIEEILEDPEARIETALLLMWRSRDQALNVLNNPVERMQAYAECDGIAHGTDRAQILHRVICAIRDFNELDLQPGVDECLSRQARSEAIAAKCKNALARMQVLLQGSGSRTQR